MRILASTPHPLWPDSSGGGRRTLSIAVALTRLGHEVTLLVPGGPAADSPELPPGVSHHTYRTAGRTGHFFNPQFARALKRQLEKGQDLVLTAYPYQAGTLIRACGRHGVPLVYDAHNCEAHRVPQLRGRTVGRLVNRLELRLTRAARAVLCVSTQDQQLFREIHGVDSLLLPNGVDTNLFRPGPPEPALLQALGLSGKRVALFFGAFDYAPNRQALARLLSLSWPLRSAGLPDTHLLVVGRGSLDCTPEQPGVIATGAVDDIARYIRLATVVLAPLESGGGTRLKIIESLACGQFVLGTPFGATGLAEQNIPGLYCCEWADFNSGLRQLLARDPGIGGNSGGAAWAGTQEWTTLVQAIPWVQLGAGHQVFPEPACGHTAKTAAFTRNPD